jgi:hypothetical protein
MPTILAGLQMSLVSSTLDSEQSLVIMDGTEKGKGSDSAGEVSRLGLTRSL